jgi:hypoxanthine phosphoribosyltransferase
MQYLNLKHPFKKDQFIQAKILLSEEQIQSRIKELAKQVREDLGEEEIMLVGILKGSFVFIADLCRELGEGLTVDFMKVSSYGTGSQSSGNIQILKDLDIDIRDKNVLIVEDIIDSGLTLSYIRDLLMTRKPKTLKVVTLLSKPECRAHNVHVEYVGFDISNTFVVGYGLDYAEYYRNLPCIVLLQLADS